MHNKDKWNLLEEELQAFEADAYAMGRSYEDTLNQLSGQEQALFGDIQRQALGFQSDLRSQILQLLQLDLHIALMIMLQLHLQIQLHLCWVTKFQSDMQQSY